MLMSLRVPYKMPAKTCFVPSIIIVKSKLLRRCIILITMSYMDRYEILLITAEQIDKAAHIMTYFVDLMCKSLQRK